MAVMVEVHPGMPNETRGEEVHQRLEGLLLRGAVVRPEGAELPLAAVAKADTEEVFEPAGLEGVALHVEEHIAGVGRRQAMKAAPALWVGGQELDARCSGL